MVILGADLHKRSHTVVVIDETGRKLAEKTVGASAEGHLELRRWSAAWSERHWALEDCRHLPVVAGKGLLGAEPPDARGLADELGGGEGPAGEIIRGEGRHGRSMVARRRPRDTGEVRTATTQGHIVEGWTSPSVLPREATK
jgi:hypothetical protein